MFLSQGLVSGAGTTTLSCLITLVMVRYMVLLCFPIQFYSNFIVLEEP